MKVYIPQEYFEQCGYISKNEPQKSALPIAKERFNEDLRYPANKKDEALSVYSKGASTYKSVKTNVING